MRFLKAFGASVLGILLFFSLVVFSSAYMLNTTLLSPGFIKKQVDRIDISALAQDIAGQQVQDFLPPELSFLEDAFYRVIDEQEPWFKAQVDRAIDDGYAFFLGETTELSINLDLSALKTDLRASLWKEFNAQIKEWIKDDNLQTQLGPYVSQNLAQYRSLLPAEAALLPDAQLEAYIDVFLKEVQAQADSPVGSIVLSGLLETLVKPFFDDYYNDYAAQIPDSLTFGQSDIPSDVMEKLLLVRKYIGIFRASFYWLIVLMVLFAAGIFLIYRNIQEPSRGLGIDLSIFGAFDLAGVLIARSFSPVQTILDSLPQQLPSLYPFITALYNDILMKALVFSIVVLAIGVALIIISFIFKKEAEIQ